MYSKYENKNQNDEHRNAFQFIYNLTGWFFSGCVWKVKDKMSWYHKLRSG